ncbi:carbohydrate sulfotransferase 11-like [Diadema setosum]|uniref:carbohydrate sulfotransferase 11-like n=1 Tax=Diadema setosum TaxID=31175 RepID=UPI003B3B3064
MIMMITIYLVHSNPQQSLTKTMLSDSEHQDFIKSGRTYSQTTDKADGADNLSGITQDHVDAATGDDFMRIQDAIQAERRQRVAETCRRHPRQQRDVLHDPPQNIIVDIPHKIFFCFVPKVACTSWKKVFLVLKGIVESVYDVNQYQVNHKLQRRLDFFANQTYAEREAILANFTKFMVAREPFARVLSAYLNKLSPNTTFSRAKHWQREIGEEITRHFYEESTIGLSGGYNVTFADFVRFLSAKEPMRKQQNRHWNELHEMCAPCDIDYDVIGKFETMSTDAEYILRLFNLVDLVDFPSANGSSPTGSSSKVEQFYSRLSAEDIKALYERYRLDFELFGYDVPERVDDA